MRWVSLASSIPFLRSASARSHSEIQSYPRFPVHATAAAKLDRHPFHNARDPYMPCNAPGEEDVQTAKHGAGGKRPPEWAVADNGAAKARPDHDQHYDIERGPFGECAPPRKAQEQEAVEEYQCGPSALPQRGHVVRVSENRVHATPRSRFLLSAPRGGGEIDPDRRVIPRLRPAACETVDAGGCQTLRQFRTEEEVVDAQSRIAREGIAEIFRTTRRAHGHQHRQMKPVFPDSIG